MSLIGDIIFTHSDPVYSPIIESEYHEAVFPVEVLQIGISGPVMTVDIEHKNKEDSTWATAATMTFTTAANKAKAVAPLLEQVHYKVTLGSPDDWARISLYPPRYRR